MMLSSTFLKFYDERAKVVHNTEVKLFEGPAVHAFVKYMTSLCIMYN